MLTLTLKQIRHLTKLVRP